MSTKHFDYAPTGQPVKKPGWFSWRHQSRDAHDAARETYLAAHGRNARQRKAKVRPVASHERTRAHRESRCGCEVSR